MRGSDSVHLPDFDELPLLGDLGLRHAWDVWGRDDVLGSINLVTPDRVARAAASVATGELIPLDLPLDTPNPPLFGREPYRHTVVALSRNEMDDRLDGFFPQGSTQWDALNHVRCREHGFWGGRAQNPTDGPNGLGIHHWARHGVAGRGVLLDVCRWYARSGRSLDPLACHAITADELREVAASQRVELQTGDVLCIRFGWIGAYQALDPAAREAFAAEPSFAGLRADEEMARFVWNAHPAALLCDNPAVEVVPGDADVGSLHRRLLPTLGTALGEMFDFDRLATRCDEDGRYTFFFVAAPLNLPGGVGSPGNAVAIR
jgi:hypothetical protein